MSLRPMYSAQPVKSALRSRRGARPRRSWRTAQPGGFAGPPSRSRHCRYGRGGRVRVEVVDPFELTHVAGPPEIGNTGATADTFVRDIIDVAGSDKHGLAGICYGVPGGEPGDRVDSRIEFRLVGPDRVPRGRAVTIASGPFRASSVNCTVGGGPLGFLVGWWDGSEPWVRRVDPT